MASSSRTASLAVLETLNIARKIQDEMDRNAYKPRKMLTPAAGIVEYKTCGPEGFIPSPSELASGLYEIGAFADTLTSSGSAFMDYLVKHNDDGHPVAKTATDVHAQACIIMKAMKDTKFSGSDENNARKFEIWFAQLLSATNGFPFILELIMNCRGHPYGAEEEIALWPFQYALAIYSEARRILLQQPRYPYKVWMKNTLHIADGTPFTHFTDGEKAIAVQFKKDTKLVWVQAEALFQSKFYRSDNMRQLLRYLKSQANNQKRVTFEPIYKTVTYEYKYKYNPSEYHEGIILSGDRNHNRAWGLAHITDGFFANATNANIK